MTHFQLKNYQIKTLKALREYLEDARFRGAKAAYESRDKDGVPSWSDYKPLLGMESVPFVCLRLPTGGGKTLLSAHTVKITAEAYLENEYPLVLWLVPTNTIRAQTLETLKKPGNPNYESLRQAFDGRFMVLDIADFTQIRPQDLQSRACIVVGTIQTLRVESTDGRKVYDHNENLEPHFTKVSENVTGLERKEDDGAIKYSFRNLLHLHRPLVIVDEAHNASSTLSHEVLRRVNAACVIEYTATPAVDSNILHNVSASELKAEEMIKLPIILNEHKSWEEAVRDSILTRERLHKIAKEDASYIRPIVLFQAEKKNQEITKDVLLKHLLEQEKIDRERIAIVTGDQKELDGIDLFDPDCKVDFVITIEALKEGWDCSFAYVFCSVANVHSAKDVEQILGRVLRMPYAKRRTHEELNRAYAHVSAASWPHAVKNLHDRLVDMGFEQEEADSFIERQRHLGFSEPAADFDHKPAPLVLELSESIDVKTLPPEDQAAIAIEKTEQGARITITGPIKEDTITKIEKAVTNRDEKASVRAELRIFKATWDKHLSPAQRGVPFNVPQLCLWIDGELELAEKELFLDAQGWNLLDGSSYPAELTDVEFKLSEQGKKYEIDINAGRLHEKLLGEIDQLNLDLVDTGWTDLQLSRWLDQRLRQPDIKQETLLEFLRRVISSLVEKRRIALTALVRNRYVLAKILTEKLRLYRARAYENGYQKTLFLPSATVETRFDYNFSYRTDHYAPRWYYKGHPYQFQKHYYALPGELENKGEEYECAIALDQCPQVKHWVRNLSQNPASFWLPTSTDKFYPDFVAELIDGRILAVEYKGKPYETNDDSKEKTNIGQLWEEKSGGKALFLMAVKSDNGLSTTQQIAKKTTGK